MVAIMEVVKVMVNIKAHMIINKSIMKQLMKIIIDKTIIKSSTQIIMNKKATQKMNQLKTGEPRAVVIPIHHQLVIILLNSNLKFNKMRADQ
jgi:hypothetical protein